MAEVKIEEIREMFRVMRESSNRALCFGEMQRELDRVAKETGSERWGSRVHSGQSSPFFGW